MYCTRFELSAYQMKSIECYHQSNLFGVSSVNFKIQMDCTALVASVGELWCGRNVSCTFCNREYTARFEVLMTVTMKILSSGMWCHVVWWIATTGFWGCTVSTLSLKWGGGDGGSRFLQTICNDPPDYMVSHLTRQYSSWNMLVSLFCCDLDI